MTDKPDYEIGYAKPPVATRFKPGNKGGGRKKGSRSIGAAVKKLLRQTIRVTEGGRSRSIPILDAMLMKLRNEALGGDPRALAMMLALSREYAPADAPDALATSAGDAQIIAEYMAKAARRIAIQSGTVSTPEGNDDD